MSLRVTNIPAFFRSRKHTSIILVTYVCVLRRSNFKLGGEKGHRIHKILVRAWSKWDWVRNMNSNPIVCLIIVIGRKTTVIVFKIFGIERAWQNRGSVGPRPRQLFITKSQLLANKVEHDYVNLSFSLSAGPDTPQYVRERIQHWKSRRKKNVLDPDDAEGTRDDLPEKYSELQDSHFPLFIDGGHCR
jgi:hypothetical protein